MSAARGDPAMPPATLGSRSLAKFFQSLPGEMYRISHGKAPLVDGSDSEKSRFSSPLLPFKVLYLAPSTITGFWERFGDELRDQEPGFQMLSKTLLEERIWKRFILTAKTPTRLLDLREPSVLRALSADASTFLGTYDVTHAWARALMDHPDELEGLIYNSRLHAKQHCVAIFGRAKFVSKKRFLSVRKFFPRPSEDKALLSHLIREGVTVG